MVKSFTEAVEKAGDAVIIEVDGYLVELSDAVIESIKEFAEELESDFEEVENFYDELNGNPVRLIRRFFGDDWAAIKEQIRDENGKVPPARVGMLLREALNGVGLKN